jgi:ribose transport system permease protein
MTDAALPSPTRERFAFYQDPKLLRRALPAVSLAAVLIAIFVLNDRAMSYRGLDLMLKYAVPIAFATIAQMFILTVNDLDLSIGAFVGLVACIAGTWMVDQPLLCLLILAGCIASYAAVGALIHVRRLPSIVVTLGMSFVWLGIAVILMPTPAGTVPQWLKDVMSWKAPLIPFPIIACVVIGLIAHLLLMESSYGAVLRGAGGNATAVDRAGWSLLKIRMLMYALAGFFGVLSGLSLIGLTTSPDAHIADRYTLLSIAGVILGGGEFVGGRVSPIGAVIGAVTLTLTGSFLIFLRISPDWQIGAQGAVLIVVLALRALIKLREAR